MQNCTVGATAESGPREPWQDIHARVEGPAAVDIHDNFVGQCTVQSSWGAVPCLAVLRIRDVYPGSNFFPSRIPDPNCLHPGSRIRIKEFKYFNPKKWFLSSRKYDPGCSSRIRMLTFYPSRIQGSKRHRIPDLDPQHCCLVMILLLYIHLLSI